MATKRRPRTEPKPVTYEPHQYDAVVIFVQKNDFEMWFNRVSRTDAYKVFMESDRGMVGKFTKKQFNKCVADAISNKQVEWWLVERRVAESCKSSLSPLEFGILRDRIVEHADAIRGIGLKRAAAYLARLCTCNQRIMCGLMSGAHVWNTEDGKDEPDWYAHYTGADDMNESERIADEYRFMLLRTEFPWCWSCGAGGSDAPKKWHGPFLIERAHIVNKPRVEDRRAVVLLCSLCHRQEHGSDVSAYGRKSKSGLELPELLWLKRRFDPKYFDREFLSKHCVGKLPRAQRPVGLLPRMYCERRGEIPNG